MLIHNFVKHDSRGLDIPENNPFDPFDPSDERSKQYPGVLQIGRVTWEDESGRSYSLNAKDLFVQILPDRSGLICLESNRQGSKFETSMQTAAFILNTDGSLRCRLEVPTELTGRDVPASASKSFGWIEKSSIGEARYGLVASIEYAGDYYFELNYHTGEFLWGKEIRS